jgi:hypothetical protein
MLLAACGPSSKVPSASCQSCGITATQCVDWGVASGCKSSTYVPGSGSQCASCKYSDCDEPPSCGVGVLAHDPGQTHDAGQMHDAGQTHDAGQAHDAGTGAGAGVDPVCATADPNRDGLFTGKAPCSEPDTVIINGVTSYTCPCGSCPCNYQCGSIPLGVGGVISSVCVPPK